MYLNFLARNEEGNAVSSGNYNQWDNGVDTGNYWDDWNGVGVYNIPGLEGCVDRFPMGQGNSTTGVGLDPITILLLTISIGSIVTISLSTIWIIKFKRKPE